MLRGCSAQMIVTLREQMPKSATVLEEKVKALNQTDEAAAAAEAEVQEMYQRVVGITELLGPRAGEDNEDGEDGEPWVCWVVKMAQMQPQPWLEFVDEQGELYHARLDTETNHLTTRASPYDWASIDEVETQLHWYYRLHPTEAKPGGPKPAGPGGAVTDSVVKRGESTLSSFSTRAGGSSSSASALRRSTLSMRAGASVSGGVKPIRCLWYNRFHEKQVAEWLRRACRQRLFCGDTPLVDSGKHMKYIERLQARCAARCLTGCGNDDNAACASVAAFCGRLRSGLLCPRQAYPRRDGLRPGASPGRAGHRGADHDVQHSRDEGDRRRQVGAGAPAAQDCREPVGRC